MNRRRFTGQRRGGKQVTKAVIQSRVTEVIELLVKGYSTHEVGVSLAPGWGVSVRTVRRYVTKAHKALAESTEIIRAAELTKAIRRFHYVYKKALSVSDEKTALSAASKVCETLKLGELGKIDLTINGKVEHEHSITPDQAETIFGILERAGALEAFAPSAQTE